MNFEKYSNRRRFNIRSVLNFGMYRNYQLGIAYVFDPKYFEWCLFNVEGFCIVDIDNLQKTPVLPFLKRDEDWQYRMLGTPQFIPEMDFYNTFDELIENVNLGEQLFSFSEEALLINKTNLKL